MTIEEVLAQVDELRPNQFSDTVKVSWLSKLDQKIYFEVIVNYEKPKPEEPEEDEEASADESEIETEEDDGTDDEEDGEDEEPEEPSGEEIIVPEEDIFKGYSLDDMSSELIVDDAYADLYIDYVFAQMDYINQELDRYTNSMTMFNSKYKAWLNFYNRTHEPISIPYKLM